MGQMAGTVAGQQGAARADEAVTPPRWRGADHLALVTRDLDATIRFYHETLGIPLAVAQGATPQHGRHCLLQAGTFFLHFFEQPDAQIYSLPVEGGQPQWGFVPGAYQHIALTLADEAALVALRARLVAAGIPVTEVLDVAHLRLIVFPDNNGITVEVNWPRVDLAARPIDYADPQRFADPDPVPAVRELRQAGTLRAVQR